MSTAEEIGIQVEPDAPQLLTPIVTSKGVHLILVEEIIQPELTQLLRQKIVSDLFLEWLKKQTNQANIMTQLHPKASIENQI